MLLFTSFVSACQQIGVVPPSAEEYADVIVPVYSFHPVFDLGSKARCAALYKQFGLGIFHMMRPEADAAKARRDRSREICQQVEYLKREYNQVEAEHGQDSDQRMEMIRGQISDLERTYAQNLEECACARETWETALSKAMGGM